METRIHNNLALYGSVVLSVNEDSFPADPAIGTLILKGNVLYAYISVGGYTTWYPFASKTSSYIHSQGVASNTWVITHNLNTTNTWTQVKDENGHVVVAPTTNTSANVVTVNFTYPIAGTAIVVAPATLDVPEMKASVVTAGNGTVIIDADGIRIAGQSVLTSANISTEVNSAVNTAISSNIGSLSSLTTTTQSNVVSAINEVKSLVDSAATTSTINTAISANVGTLSSLTTTAKSNVVSAINEINSTLTTWNNLPYDLGSTVVGKPTASEVIFRFRAVRAFTLQSSGHEIVANVAATASSVFTITKNTTSIGTVTFAASGTTPSVSISQTSFAAGDRLIITAPASVDSTLADIDFTLLAKLG